MTKTHIKFILFTMWSIIVGLAIYFYFNKGLSITEITEELRGIIRQSGVWGPVLYVIIYSFRSLIFFPASVLTIISGILFGPWLGLVLALIGENISANLSFVVGRYFTADLLKFLNTTKNFLPRLICKIRNNGFLTVLIMRLTFLPFDLVGYSSGMCNIRQKDFALATVIGTIPGLATFVFLGGSFTDLRYLVLAAVVLAFSLVVSVFLKNSSLSQTLTEKG